MNEVRLTVFDTELGWMAAAWEGKTIYELTFGHRTPQTAVQSIRYYGQSPSSPDRFAKDMMKRLKAFCLDPDDDFRDIQLDVSTRTEFQRKVLECCRRIRPGETRSYAQLADAAGRPRAARAVGQVMATNRFPIIVPCHRVVGSNGPGGYSAPDGLEMKRRLLLLEGIQLTGYGAMP